MIKEFDHLYKTVIIGNSGVGKSAILVRFVENQFSEHYLATIGVDFRFKTIQVDGKNVKFQIWDTAGQERFRTITSAYYRGSQGILLVFDLTDPLSFENICKFWMNEVETYAEKDAIFFLIGNKSDLNDQRQVPQDKIKEFCELKNLTYMECSAKEGEKIKEIFVELARKLEEKLNLKNVKATPDKKGASLVQPTKDKQKKCC
jgi:Ras-related protein Rab-1A